MTDVACVDLKYLPVNQLTCSSFGGGSEMLRDGDNIGILRTLARSQRYDDGISSWPISSRSISFFLCYCPYRNRIFMSHVPWLGATMLSYPRLIPDYKTFHMYAQERAARRIKEGSPYRDLFYHLVCDIVHLPARRILMIRPIDR